jgi:hypothetical protein
VRRPFPQFGDVLEAGEQVYKSNYNGGFVSVKRAFANGLSFQTSYTYSKELDDLSPVDYYNLQRRYGPGGLTRRHNFVWESVYELPFGPGRPFLRSDILSKIIGGWTLGNIWSWQTGAPITIGNVSNTCNCFSELNQGVNLVPGASLGGHPANFDPGGQQVVQRERLLGSRTIHVR